MKNNHLFLLFGGLVLIVLTHSYLLPENIFWLVVIEMITWLALFDCVANKEHRTTPYYVRSLGMIISGWVTASGVLIPDIPVVLRWTLVFGGGFSLFAFFDIIPGLVQEQINKAAQQ